MRLIQLLPHEIRRPLRKVVDSLRAWARYLELRRPGYRPPGRPRDHGPVRVCLLAQHFPPEVTGGSYRPTALATYGSEDGLSVSVVAGAFEQVPSAAGRYLADRIPEEVDVHRARVPDLTPFEWAVPKLDGGFLDLLEITRAAERSFRKGRPDVVLASGPSFHTFVAAYLLARNTELPLILEYRDEWTECPFDFVRSGRGDRRWEARCLAAADRVVFTTEAQMRHCLATFPVLDASRCAVIPNGWEPRDWEEVSAAVVPDPGATGSAPVAFVGNLGDHTLPGPFLETLERAVHLRPSLSDRIRIRWVGKKSRAALEQIRDFPVPRMLDLVPQVPKGEASRIMRESGGLLLLNGPRLERYLPGKLYEYVAARRPILVFGAGGEIAALVTRLNAGDVVPAGEPESLATALWALTEPSEETAESSRARWLAEHTREATAHRTIRMIRERSRRRTSPKSG